MNPLHWTYTTFQHFASLRWKGRCPWCHSETIVNRGVVWMPPCLLSCNGPSNYWIDRSSWNLKYRYFCFIYRLVRVNIFSSHLQCRWKWSHYRKDSPRCWRTWAWWKCEVFCWLRPRTTARTLAPDRLCRTEVVGKGYAETAGRSHVGRGTGSTGSNNHIWGQKLCWGKSLVQVAFQTLTCCKGWKKNRLAWHNDPLCQSLLYRYSQAQLLPARTSRQSSPMENHNL